jgi:hypothetical protein
MKSLMSFSSYDASILWKFFDGVSDAVANRLLRGSPPGEENLTFLLCELLDESSTGLHVLGYPLTRAKEDLEKSDTGMTVDVQFVTHEHPKHIESKYSGADLGIVFVVQHPIVGYSRRAVLVQAKKLFPQKPADPFSLYSRYTHYDKDQAEFLQELERRFEVWDSIFYLWYNPPSGGFREDDAKLLRAYEAHSNTLMPLWGRVHPILDELLETGLPFFSAGRALGADSRQEDHDAEREWRARQPAIRVSALDTTLSIASVSSPPQLKTFYDRQKEHGRRYGRFAFAPFAEFFLLGLFNERIGNSKQDWVRLAEGQKVPMPPAKPSAQPSKIEGLDNLQQVPVPRHTITLTLRSTLPEVG